MSRQRNVDGDREFIRDLEVLQGYKDKTRHSRGHTKETEILVRLTIAFLPILKNCKGHTVKKTSFSINYSESMKYPYLSIIYLSS